MPACPSSEQIGADVSRRAGMTARGVNLFVQITFAAGEAYANSQMGHPELLHLHGLSGLPFLYPACSDLARTQIETQHWGPATHSGTRLPGGEPHCHTPAV